MRKSSSKPLTQPTTKDSVDDMKTHTPATILVADDDLDMVRLFTNGFAQKGYRVVEALDGNQAWDVLQQEQPDVVILDVMLPEKSGWEVARAMRQDALLQRTHIVMTTEVAEHLSELTSALCGAHDFICKPIPFDELHMRVARLLQDKKIFGQKA